MNQFPTHTYSPNSASDIVNTMAVGSAVLGVILLLLSLALTLYIFLMPFLIYLRLGRIARAVETSQSVQKSLLIELKELVATQQKTDRNATVQTTLLTNLDQNLAMGINKVLPKS